MTKRKEPKREGTVAELIGFVNDGMEDDWEGGWIAGTLAIVQARHNDNLTLIQDLQDFLNGAVPEGTDIQAMAVSLEHRCRTAKILG
jgi:hypothetical protein